MYNCIKFDNDANHYFCQLQPLPQGKETDDDISENNNNVVRFFHSLELRKENCFI